MGKIEMTKYLVGDVETSGLMDFKLPADHPSQPRVCGFTLIPVGDDLQPDDALFTALIQPDGWEISPEITAINGLTTEKCAAEGIPITDALTIYTNFIKEGRVWVSFNAQFDLKCFRSELRRLDLPDLFEETPNICAMRSCGGLGIEKAGDKKGGFPKLTDAYRHFFSREMVGAHTSLGDATAHLEVFRELVKIGKAKAPAVHYAKNRPEGAVDRAPAVAAAQATE